MLTVLLLFRKRWKVLVLSELICQQPRRFDKLAFNFCKWNSFSRMRVSKSAKERKFIKFYWSKTEWKTRHLRRSFASHMQFSLRNFFFQCTASIKNTSFSDAGGIVWRAYAMHLALFSFMNHTETYTIEMCCLYWRTDHVSFSLYLAASIASMSFWMPYGIIDTYKRANKPNRIFISCFSTIYQMRNWIKSANGFASIEWFFFAKLKNYISA